MDCMFAVRMLLGLLKGGLIGGLVGYGLAVAGLGVTSALIAYPIAALVGVLVALIAGKPVWAEDSKIQVYLKMGVGALFAPGLLFLARRFLTMGLPFDAGVLPGVSQLQSAPAIGMFAVSALAMVGAVLAAFYDADNSPDGQGDDKEAQSSKKASASKRRISAEVAAITGLDVSEIEEAEEARSRQASKE